MKKYLDLTKPRYSEPTSPVPWHSLNRGSTVPWALEKVYILGPVWSPLLSMTFSLFSNYQVLQDYQGLSLVPDYLSLTRRYCSHFCH